MEQLQPSSSKDLEVEYLNFLFEDDDDFEYEQGKDQKFKKGSLRSNIYFWKEIEASEFILDVVENGYKLPFQSVQAQKEFKNNKSSLIHSDFVTASIRDLLESNRIVELHSKPHVVSPRYVSANKEKKRLILNLRYVNQHLERQRVRFEDWKVFQNYLVKDGYLFKFDLKSGYHHIEINLDFQTFLGFSWVFEGKTRYFAFSVLPFGLSTAAFIFTKVCRPLVKLWRFNGIKIVLYLDDGFSISNSHSECLSDANFVRNTLLKSGFIPNQDKSVWQPTNICDWLGIIIDTKEGYLRIPEQRISSLISSIKQVQRKLPLVNPRDLTSVAGKTPLCLLF